MTNSLNLTDLLIYQQSVLRNILFEYIKGIGIYAYWEYIQEYILLEYDQKYTFLNILTMTIVMNLFFMNKLIRKLNDPYDPQHLIKWTPLKIQLEWNIFIEYI